MGDFVLHDGTRGRRRFEELLADRFPAIAAEISEDERGFLHLEMAAVARATCSAIDRGDFKEVGMYLSFIDELLRDAPPDLENAICVSYLEDVFLGPGDERYSCARSMLSDPLQAALVELEEDWKRVDELSRKRPSDA